MRMLVLTTAVCLAAVGLAVASEADAGIRKSTNIPAQPLEPALQVFARERDVQVIFRSEVVDDLRSPGAMGNLTVNDALEQLLRGTGLTFQYVDEKTITLIPAMGNDAPRAQQAEGYKAADDIQQEDTARRDSLWARFRVAQVDHGALTSPVAVNEDNSVRLEEVVVTAQKREQRLIDVPISIVALNADELHKRKVTDIDDLPSAVPGLSVESLGGTYRVITLRGIGNSLGSSSLVGVYLDEASVTSNAQFQTDVLTYDLERVEVLRGPQGTLYGEGSVGGTIRFITRNPALDRFGANMDVQAMATQGGAPSQKVQGMVNIPLLQNVLGLRIAGTYQHDGGWIDQPLADRRNINGQNLKDVRVKALWQPLPEFTANAMALVHRNNGGLNVGEDANGNYTQVFNLTTTPRVEDDYDLYNLTLSYDFPAARLLNAASYMKHNTNTLHFGDRSIASPPAPPGYPRVDIYFDDDLDVHILTEELRLSSNGAGLWQWTVGGYYRRFRLDENDPIGYYGTLLFNFPYQTLSRSNSAAAFGDTSYRLTDRVTLGAGLRYFHDRQEFEYFGVGNQEGRFHALNPRVYAQLKLTEGMNAYASAAKGFRSGGFNSFPNQPAYGPESVWTYELGTKASWGANRISMDAALFYSDYTNYQIFGTVPAAGGSYTAISNAGSARLEGIEWGLQWRPTADWELGFSGDYLHSRFYKVNLISGTYAVGDPVDLAPKYQFTLSAQRNFKVGSHSGFARLDYSRQGRETLRNRNAAGPTPWYFNESDLIDMLNLNAGMDWNETLSFGLFARNLLNERGFLDPRGIYDSAARPRPRSYGVEFGVKLH